MKWNDIEKGLPPAGTPLIVSVDRNCQFGAKKVVLAPVYYMKDWRSGQWGFFEFGDINSQIGPESFPVVAWKEYPKPYVGRELSEE